jgi:hypothetical protein
MIRYSMEITLYGLSQPDREDIVSTIENMVRGRVRVGTSQVFDPNRVMRGDVTAFVEIVEFTSGQDGILLWSQILRRVQNTAATTNAAGTRPSYIRMTATDDGAMQITRWRSTSPDWADDPGVTTPL